LYLINIHWGRSLCVFSFSLLTSHHILHNDCYKCLFNFFHLSDSIFPLVTYLVISSTKNLEIIFHLCFMKSKKFSILPHFLSSMCPFSCERYFFYAYSPFGCLVCLALLVIPFQHFLWIY
jgi:hypothetical protein